MRAVVLDQYGGTEVLAIREVPDPVPGPDEVLVDIVSTAMNRADLLQRMGLYRAPDPQPQFEIPGLEFAGRVAACGERVIRWQVGDAVMGIVGGGGHATRIAVHERQCMRVPAGVPLSDAGSIPEVWLTAFDALVTQGGLCAGGAVLIHAGASGVGTAAIQLARRAHASQVIATASADKGAACSELGADVVVDYRSEDFVAAAKEATGGRGVDVILDVVGGDYLDRNVAALANRGRIVQVGVMGGGATNFNLGALMMKRAAVVGTVLRARPIEEKIAATLQFESEVLGGFDDGSLRTVIDSRFALDEIAAAHERMAANANIGKIIIDVQET